MMDCMDASARIILNAEHAANSSKEMKIKGVHGVAGEPMAGKWLKSLYPCMSN